jgi:hypothetical protein
LLSENNRLLCWDNPEGGLFLLAVGGNRRAAALVLSNQKIERGGALPGIHAHFPAYCFFLPLSYFCAWCLGLCDMFLELGKSFPNNLFVTLNSVGHNCQEYE